MSKRGRKSKIVAELDRLTRTCGSSAAAKDAEPIQRDTGAIREEDISGMLSHAYSLSAKSTDVL